MKPLITLLLCLVCVPAFAQVDAPNAHLWASVRITNGGMGSGTIISPEGFGVTCGHLFRGKIGGQFTVAFADGGECQGTLLYHRLGNDQDIALFSIPKEQVRGYAPVAENPPSGEVRAVGYPGGEGPKLVSSSFVGHYPGRDKWQFAQYINNGQSGGGIFQGPYLVGVMVEKNRGGQGEPGDICNAVPLPTIVNALEAQCGPEGCSPGGALGRIFTPRPNVPLGNPPRGNGQIPPPAPRSDDPPKIDINDLPGPEPEPTTPDPYLGHKRPVPGPAGPAGPKGDKGDTGPAGPAGKDGKGADPLETQRILGLLEANQREITLTNQRLEAAGKKAADEDSLLKAELLRLQQKIDSVSNTGGTSPQIEARLAALEAQINSKMRYHLRQVPVNKDAK